MPYSLPLPKKFKGLWKVKIFDNELLVEEPHVTIIRKTDLWRFSLRTKKILDSLPDPKDVPAELIAEIEKHQDKLTAEWDERFPKNPVKGDENDD